MKVSVVINTYNRSKLLKFAEISCSLFYIIYG